MKCMCLLAVAFGAVLLAATGCNNNSSSPSLSTNAPSASMPSTNGPANAMPAETNVPAMTNK